MRASSQVRGNVGRALAVEAVLGSVLGVVQVETTHVELFSHIDGVVVGETGKGFVFVICAVMSSRDYYDYVSAGSAVSDRRKKVSLSDETRKSRQKRA